MTNAQNSRQDATNYANYMKQGEINVRINNINVSIVKDKTELQIGTTKRIKTNSELTEKTFLQITNKINTQREWGKTEGFERNKENM